MNLVEITDLIKTLPEEKQVEVLDFVRFLKSQAAKDRILAADKEERLTFNSVHELMNSM